MRYIGGERSEYQLSSHSTLWESGVPVYKHMYRNFFIYKDESGKWKNGGPDGLAKRQNTDPVVASSRLFESKTLKQLDYHLLDPYQQ